MQSNDGPVLLFDAMNCFCRHYIRNPSMSTHGHHAGGIVGFLGGLKHIVDMTGASEVYVCWESGGNARRRALFPGYKSGRKPPKLNRYYEGEIPDTAENRVYQIQTLVALLRNAPVCQLYIEDCEADDVIGYLSRNRFRDQKKVVVSSDKDFYQLLDENTTMYSWTSKSFVTHGDVVQQFGISSKNFAVAKALSGDSSDNVPGVQGLGFKTIARRFPQLGSDQDVLVGEILEESRKKVEENPKGPKLYGRILENADLINRNLRLMYLDVSNLAAVQVRKIDAVVDDFRPQRNKLKMMQELNKEGLPTFDVHDFFGAFRAS